MRKLQPHELSTLRHVHHHRRVCLGEITSQADALLAETMARLAKWKFLMEEPTQDGPAYTVAYAALQIVENWID
jgi:hypothetical protein